LSTELPHDLRPVADFFGLPGTAAVAKDFHVVRAIGALAALDAAPFSLIFGGGTALARAHRLVRRMSEDVDFKIVPRAAAPVTKSGLHRQLSALRGRVTEALLASGFAFDPKNPAHLTSRNESRYTVWHLPYASAAEAGGLRPTIQIELTYAPLRSAPVTRSVASFVAEATEGNPEVPAISCVGVMETAAEKLVSLTRRTAMDLAGLARDADPALMRHIYDLHMMRGLFDPAEVAALARDIAAADAEEFRNQYPAYAADITGETHKALAALCTNPRYRARYEQFMADMVYGERPEFDEALKTVIDINWLE
jgi:predicted nucleotidyltransferase component of viral defense system